MTKKQNKKESVADFIGSVVFVGLISVFFLLSLLNIFFPIEGNEAILNPFNPTDHVPQDAFGDDLDCDSVYEGEFNGKISWMCKKRSTSHSINYWRLKNICEKSPNNQENCVCEAFREARHCYWENCSTSYREECYTDKENKGFTCRGCNCGGFIQEETCLSARPKTECEKGNPEWIEESEQYYRLGDANYSECHEYVEGVAYGTFTGNPLILREGYKCKDFFIDKTTCRKKTAEEFKTIEITLRIQEAWNDDIQPLKEFPDWAKLCIMDYYLEEEYAGWGFSKFIYKNGKLYNDRLEIIKC